MNYRNITASGRKRRKRNRSKYGKKYRMKNRGKPGNRRLLSRQIKNLFCSLNLKFMMKIIL